MMTIYHHGHQDDHSHILKDDSGSGCSEDVCRGAVEGLNITSPVPARPIPAQVENDGDDDSEGDDGDGDDGGDDDSDDGDAK